MTSTRPPGSQRARIREVDWETFRAIAASAGVTLPIEQTAVWDSFDITAQGREPWGRVLYRDRRGRDRALVSLARMSVRGFPYLWARHGPVWLGAEPTAGEEQELRALLARGVGRRDPRVVFLRLHAAIPGPDCHELLQTMTYDRTVIIDLDQADDEALLASFKSRGRRDVRKALRNEELTFHDETAQAEDVFGELYEILTETGERDGFRAAPEQTYRTMLRALGPRHARLFVARRSGREALAWSLVTVYGDSAVRYYAGSAAAGRRMRASDALLYKEACRLRAEGVRHYDLMGVDSKRVPELAGVREFKSKFAPQGPVDVPGAWDVPVRPLLYTALVKAMGLKWGLKRGLGRQARPHDAKGGSGGGKGRRGSGEAGSASVTPSHSS
ncbi:peptidoglycan bridge formation glycyltransferase FemA/FemB family protein [Actinomyces bowdenii]|uniref:lipid II:glycine glycyltransferase FemX n=1 Tax=Actinomyces bowdenii TaxID=131109 RepID=UPI00214BE469|nr:GNAT family N-acetyltransferase [Actinomyces bowdenii]MCR2052218.1 peptidoglycan bridge formation glycyltransferase FemA/FemB family protein [Actinomyces bowdenii]